MYKQTKYFELVNGEWIPTTLNDVNIAYHWIPLYDDNLQQIGIGMYKRHSIR